MKSYPNTEIMNYSLVYEYVHSANCIFLILAFLT